MKFILSLLFLLVCMCAAAQSNYNIEYPKIDEKLAQHFQEVYRVERTDTALLIYGCVYNRPNYWVQVDTGWLQGSTTGRRYRLVRSYDFPLSKKIGMPASGSREVTLQFELPDSQDRIVDYYDVDGSLLFKGIHLYSEKNKGFRCLIRGTISDSNQVQCSRLILHPYGADIRVQSYISIPVKNGRFEYPLYSEERMIYTLLDWHDYLMGSWRPQHFWVEPGLVEMCYSPASLEDKETVIIPHTPLNKEKMQFEKSLKERFNDTLLFQESERLRNENRCYSEKMQECLKTLKNKNVNRDSIYKVMQQLELTGEMYTPEMQKVNRKFIKRTEQMNLAELEYARKPSLNGLYILTEHLKKVVEYGYKIETAGIIQLYREKYQRKFGGHPLALQVERYINALSLKKGGHFIDFTAPDLQGNMVKASEYIRGKVALIDLWASWCGSCRRSSMSMLPVYREFKDKGFTILGVARESKDTREMEAAIQKDGYPWLNLVELNDRGAIWYKYGVGNAGGITLLVDQQGVILAVRPTADEVREILQEMLGK